MFETLKPLQKPHYSWPIPKEKIFTIGPDLNDYIRITANCTLSDGMNDSQLKFLLDICKKYNANLSYCTSPWHRVWKSGDNPEILNEEHGAEISYFAKELAHIVNYIKSYNQLNSSNLLLTAIILDSERFYSAEASDAKKLAMKVKYDAIYDTAKYYSPSTKVMYYWHGTEIDGPNLTGYTGSPWFGVGEKSDIDTLPLYKIWELQLNHDLVKRLKSEAIAFVALGAGYQRKKDIYQRWNESYDYDVIYSWALGGMINHPWFGERPERFAPYNLIKGVIFYPAPFDNRNDLIWRRHFVEYCKGAQIEVS